MKKTLCLLGLLTASMPAYATVYFYDGFDYTANTDLSTPWTQTETNPIQAGSSGLSYPNYGYNSTGVSAEIDSVFSEVQAPLSQAFSLTGAGNSGTLYMSYLVDVTADSTWGYSLYVGLTDSALDYDEGLYVGLNKMGGSSTAFGGAIGRPNAEEFQTGGAVGTGSGTHLVVAKFDWAGGTQYNEVTDGLTISMEVYNGTTPTEEPTTWSVSYSETKGSPHYGPDSVWDTVIIHADNTSIRGNIDEIYVGDSFRSVVPEPGSVALALGTLAGLFTLWHRRRA